MRPLKTIELLKIKIKKKREHIGHDLAANNLSVKQCWPPMVHSPVATDFYPLVVQKRQVIT